jgi:hypothetical protein
MQPSKSSPAQRSHNGKSGATRLASGVETEAAFRAEAGTCILHDDGGSENACEFLSRALSGARKPTAIIVLRTTLLDTKKLYRARLAEPQ